MLLIVMMTMTMVVCLNFGERKVIGEMSAKKNVSWIPQIQFQWQGIEEQTERF